MEQLVQKSKQDESRGSNEEHVVIFLLANEHYALDIRAVQEIVRMQAITSIPGADAWMTGITNLRGRVVPVIDLRVRCGLTPSDVTAETRIVVVNGGGSMVGLIVDGVSEVMRIPGDQIEASSSIVAVPATAHIRGVAKLPDRLVSLMDLDGVLPVLESSVEPGAATLAAA